MQAQSSRPIWELTTSSDRADFAAHENWTVVAPLCPRSTSAYWKLGPMTPPSGRGMCRYVMSTWKQMSTGALNLRMDMLCLILFSYHKPYMSGTVSKASYSFSVASLPLDRIGSPLDVTCKLRWIQQTLYCVGCTLLRALAIEIRHKLLGRVPPLRSCLTTEPHRSPESTHQTKSDETDDANIVGQCAHDSVLI